MAERILILGGTSAIAMAVAARFASAGCRLYLVGRNEDKLTDAKKQLLSNGAAEVHFEIADLANLPLLSQVVANAFERFGGFERTIVAHGELSAQGEGETSWRKTMEGINLNFVSPAIILTCVAEQLANARSGQIIVIGSVAGDRGRKSNYIYGSAKGGLEKFTEGLRNRLHSSGVSVLLVKPGFVDTPMTANIKKNFLFSNPDAVAGRIVKSALKDKNTIYVPGYWRLIMLVIRSIPEIIFKRLSL